MPRPSLTEEIEQLAYGLANAMIAEHDATAAPERGMTGYWQDVVRRNRRALMSRLTALETELAGYRKETAIIPDSEPRISARSGMALPCTSEYVNAQSAGPAPMTDLGNPEE